MTSPDPVRPFETLEDLDANLRELAVAFHARLSHTARCTDSAKVGCICGLTELRTGLQRVADFARLAFVRSGEAPRESSGSPIVHHASDEMIAYLLPRAVLEAELARRDAMLKTHADFSAAAFRTPAEDR